MFRINSYKDHAVAYRYAKTTLASKGLELTWETELILLIWRVFHRKRYIVALLLYIRGKYQDRYEPLIHARKLNQFQIEAELLTNGWY